MEVDFDGIEQVLMAEGFKFNWDDPARPARGTLKYEHFHNKPTEIWIEWPSGRKSKRLTSLPSQKGTQRDQRSIEATSYDVNAVYRWFRDCKITPTEAFKGEYPLQWERKSPTLDDPDSAAERERRQREARERREQEEERLRQQQEEERLRREQEEERLRREQEQQNLDHLK